MINEAIYQKIYDEIYKYLIPDASKLIIYLEYGVASYSFSFYIKKGKNYIKCFELSGVSEEDLAESFSKIDKIVDAERKKGKETWSNMTMIVDAEGNMHTDFDYTDLSEGNYEFKKSWKKKYLI